MGLKKKNKIKGVITTKEKRDFILLLRKITCSKDWKNHNASEEDDRVSAVHPRGRMGDPGLCRSPTGANSKMTLNNAKGFVGAQFGLRESTPHPQQGSAASPRP